MKNIHNITSTLLLFIAVNSYSQVEPFYKSYDWEEKPTLKADLSDTSHIINYKEKIVEEFFFTDDDQLTEYYLNHKIVWLNSDQEIENNNKIYLPYSNSSELEVYKARVITKEGKVINLGEDKIQTAEDDDGKSMYKYFTFEGLEKGSFIEYITVYKQYPRYGGVRMSLQNSHLKYNVEFDLYAPRNLDFEFKSYNGLADVEKDTVIEDKAHWSIVIDTMQPLEKESRANYNVHRQFLIYKLDKNLAARIYDISSYSKSASNVYNNLYNDISKSDRKAIKKIIKSTKAADIKDKTKQIRAVEDYVKKNIFKLDVSNPELSKIASIVKNKVANDHGMVKLYAQIFKALDVNTQIVITSDRSQMEFDKDFEAGNYLTDYLLYFPSVKEFMSPIEIDSRLGFPPSELTNNYGLFVKEVSLGDYTTGIGKIKYIKPVDYQKNFNDIIVDVEFDEKDISNTIVNIDHSKGGYYAMNAQTILHLVDEETKKEIIEEQIKFINENLEVTNPTVYNDNAEAFGLEPLRVTAEVETDVFVEKAGPKYLFKIGELIGPQMEMYEEKKRRLPLDTRFANLYHRTITFTIPEGYEVKNLEDINISNETTDENGDVIYKFETSYTIKDNKVTVTGIEFYVPIVIETKLYEEYRKVMNSAADFNKVTLILVAK